MRSTSISPKLRCAVALVVVPLILLSACKTTSDEETVVKADPAAAPVEVKVPVTPEPPAPTPIINGFQIAEFEYWPFRWKATEKTCTYPYPTAVRYGFDAGSEAARRCMREAYAGVWALLHNPPEALKRLRDNGGPTTIYLWINDYTEAKTETSGEPVADCRPDESMRHIWHYNPPAGPIKWVGEVNKDGSCRLPTVADLTAFADAVLTSPQ